MASTSTAASASASASKRKGGASAASAPAAKSKKPSYKFALTLALYYLPGDDAVDPGATSIVRTIQGAVFSGDVWDAKSMVRAPVAAGPPPSPQKKLPPPPSLSLRDHAPLRSRRPCFPRLVYVHPVHGRAPSPPHRLLV